MRYIIFTVTLLLFCIRYSANTFAATDTNDSTQTIVLKFSEVYCPEPKLDSKKRFSMHKKFLRESTDGLRIKLDTADESIPQNVKECLEIASALWSNAIKDSSFVNIQVKYENDLSDDIITEVSYKLNGKIAIPSSFGNFDESTSKCSGIIHINSSVEWDYKFGENSDSNKRNLTFGLLRSIGRILGVGSTIRKDEDNNYKSVFGRAYSNFDCLVIRSDNKHLHEIPRTGTKVNPALKEYIEADGMTFYVSNNTDIYDLHNGPFSAGYPPFCALSDGLMAPEIGIGDYYLNIDDSVLGVLEMLGWDVVKNNVFITSDDMENDGTLTAWKDHVFYLSDKINGINNSRWHFTIPLVYETFETDLTDDEESCVITKLFDYFHPEDVLSSSDGIINCYLDYSFYKDKIPLKFKPIEIKLNQKPKIFEVNITEIEFSDDDYSYRVHFEVEYGGKNYILVSTEEEYGHIIQTVSIDQPEKATGVTPWVYSEGYVWIDFTVNNEYGNYKVSYEFEPYASNWYELQYNTKSLAAIRSVRDHHSDDIKNGKFTVYDTCGNVLWMGSDLSQLYNISYKGIAIVRSNSDKYNKSFKLTL